MTDRISIFDSPFLLGFDHFERLLDRAARSGSEGYPPYNIEQISDTKIRITIAVAGFSMDDLSIHMEQNQLVIQGKRESQNDEDRVFLHRGIATRQFKRSFILSDEIEVEEASMDNGLLHIDLIRILPEIEIKKIDIKSKEKSKKDQTIEMEKKPPSLPKG